MTNETPELRPDPDPDTDELATVVQRAGARLVDWFIFMGIWMILLVAGAGVGAGVDNDIPAWVVLTWMAIIGLYETVLVAVRGQTVGKWALGIRVAAVADGENPPFIRAFLRVAPVLAVVAVGGNRWFAPMLLVFVYYTAAFAAESLRGVLDRLAGTVVVKGG